MAGTPFAILRKRQEKRREAPVFSMQSVTGSLMPKDIFSLINEFHCDVKNTLAKEDIRQKINENSNSLNRRDDSAY